VSNLHFSEVLGLELGKIELIQNPKDATEADSAVVIVPGKEKRNAKGETPLHVACRAGNVKRVQTLLEKGSSVTSTVPAGWTPLVKPMFLNTRSLMNVNENQNVSLI